MNTQKKDFQNEAKTFLETLFSESLNKGYGEIEIRAILGKKSKQYFFNSIDKAIECAYDLCDSGMDVYFGVNPRMDRGGGKENIKYLTCFHVDIDYGKAGHKKSGKYETYYEALNAIKAFKLQPTLINHSGGGFHLYFVLNKPVKVDAIGVEILENINKSLSLELGGDSGTHDLPRILRIPGT